MKILFMGTPEFACPSLDALHNSGHEICAVVTGTDKPSGRGKKVMPTPVAQMALKFDLNILKPKSLKSDKLFNQIAELKPDLIVVIAFRILPENLFSLPEFGSINIHGSLLPKYRGAAPINYALMHGDKETGLSAFYLKKEVDTGDLINQIKTPIEDNDNFDSLYEKMAAQSAPFLLETIEQIKSGKTSPIKQDDSLASLAPKINPFMALIDFGMPADKIRNFVRSLSSKPGAFSFMRGKKLKILECRISDFESEMHTRPGTIIKNKKKFIVQCANSTIEITTVIPEGKKQMDGLSLLNGMRPEVGEVLGEIPKESDLTK
jgi:methionyl-tRNA formyltransferase